MTGSHKWSHKWSQGHTNGHTKGDRVAQMPLHQKKITCCCHCQLPQQPRDHHLLLPTATSAASHVYGNTRLLDGQQQCATNAHVSHIPHVSHMCPTCAQPATAHVCPVPPTHTCPPPHAPGPPAVAPAAGVPHTHPPSHAPEPSAVAPASGVPHIHPPSHAPGPSAVAPAARVPTAAAADASRRTMRPHAPCAAGGPGAGRQKQG